MSDTADFEFDTSFYDEAPADWALDPLAEETGGMIAVQRVSLVRIACVAAETGARLQRDGLSVDPVGWMITPLELFEGRAPIEACMEREACSKAILLHGLGLGLDADPRVMSRLLASRDAAGGPERDHA